MSRLLSIEHAWAERVTSVAARGDTALGTVTIGSTIGITSGGSGWSEVDEHWRFAIIEFTSGTLAGEWRVVTSYNYAAGVASFGWHDALPSAPAAESRYRLSFEPLNTATVFTRGVLPASMSEEELPAVILATERRRTLEAVAIGRGPGARRARYELRTDLLSPWSQSEEDEVIAHKLYAQIDAMRGVPMGLPGVAYGDTPGSADEIASYGELDRGTRVYWSVVQQQWSFMM